MYVHPINRRGNSLQDQQGKSKTARDMEMDVWERMMSSTRRVADGKEKRSCTMVRKGKSEMVEKNRQGKAK